MKRKITILLTAILSMSMFMTGCDKESPAEPAEVVAQVNEIPDGNVEEVENPDEVEPVADSEEEPAGEIIVGDDGEILVDMDGGHDKEYWDEYFAFEEGEDTTQYEGEPAVKNLTPEMIKAIEDASGLVMDPIVGSIDVGESNIYTVPKDAETLQESSVTNMYKVDGKVITVCATQYSDTMSKITESEDGRQLIDRNGDTVMWTYSGQTNVMQKVPNLDLGIIFIKDTDEVNGDIDMLLGFKLTNVDNIPDYSK